MTTAPIARLWYDYDHQAWVDGDRYAPCGHQGSLRASGRCCFAGTHAGQLVAAHLSPERIEELRVR